MEDSFADLMGRLQQGDQRAATDVFNRFANRLIGLARSRLNSNIQQKEDPEDVLQSVFRSFFIRNAGQEFTLQNWDDLWAVLVVITVRKCGGRLDYYQAGRRDVKREKQNPDWTTDVQAIARDPTASEIIMLGELVEEIMRGLEGRERQIVCLRLQGHSVPEIKGQIGCSERTVFRVLERVKKRLERHSEMNVSQ